MAATIDAEVIRDTGHLVDMPDGGIDLSGDGPATRQAASARPAPKTSKTPLVIAVLVAMAGAVGYGVMSGRLSSLMPGAQRARVISQNEVTAPGVPMAKVAPAAPLAAPTMIGTPVPASAPVQGMLAEPAKPPLALERVKPDARPNTPSVKTTVLPLTPAAAPLAAGSTQGEVEELKKRIRLLEAKLAAKPPMQASSGATVPVKPHVTTQKKAAVAAKASAESRATDSTGPTAKPQTVTVVGITQGELVVRKGGNEMTMHPGDRFTNGERINKIDDKAMTVETDQGVYKVKL